MKKLTTLFMLLSGIHLFGQTPALIFHSGFEPNTDTTLQGSGSADIIGIDLSVTVPNDWVNDLETHPNIGTFNIQYQGGTDTMRLAEIVSGPINPLNNVMEFWIKYPNVPVDSVTNKGRVQANLYNNSGITNLYYSIRLFLPSDLDTLKYIPAPVNWFTLMEFWNNPGWLGNPYPFRVTVDLKKITSAPDSLRFGVHGQTMDTINDVWINVWDTTNLNFAVPTGKWITIEINYIEGDSTTGRFYMAVTPDGAGKTVLYDLTEYTYHPMDPTPDGLTHFNPFKLYTSGGLIDSIRNWGKLTHVYWDDFEIWIDSTVTTGFDEYPTLGNFNIYPNPTSQYATLEFDNFQHEKHTLTLYDIQGRTVRTITSITADRIEIEIKDLKSGLYFFQLNTNWQVRVSGKLIIE